MFLNSYVCRGTVKQKNLISLADTPREDVFEYLYRTRDFKRKAAVGEKTLCLSDRFIALISKPSYFRSIAAFQIAVQSLGGHPILIPLSGTDIDESLKDKDVIRNMHDFGVSTFMVDTSYLHDAELLEQYADIPVINANAKYGPCFAFATLCTAWEKFGKLTGLKMTYIGDCSDFDNSLLIGAAKCGINLSIVTTDENPPSTKLVNYCKQFCNVEVYNNKDDGIRGSDIVYVQENNYGETFIVNELDLAFAHKEVILLHSFPNIRSLSPADDITDCPQSMVFEQSANLIPALKAALSFVDFNKVSFKI